MTNNWERYLSANYAQKSLFFIFIRTGDIGYRSLYK